MSIRVRKDDCDGCGICISCCPFSAIRLADEIACIDLDICTLCGACVSECPSGAILIDQAVGESLSSHKGVWIYGEIAEDGGGPHRVVYELLSKGRELADSLDTDLSVVFIGDANPTEDFTEAVIRRGANKVYIVKHNLLQEFMVEPWTDALVELVEKYRPEILLAGATSEGRSLLPRVAARLKTGLTADCTELDIDANGLLLQTRPAFGGNIMARIICEYRRPQMATVRYKVMKEAEIKERTGKVIFEEFNPRKYQTNLIQHVIDKTQKIKVEDADIIVSGGRGLGDKKNFALLEELATLLGAALGSSRPAVDDGWIPYSHQVGQTGKTVRPKLYIACGISGSIQHLAGMSSSDYIIAINKDPSAPIFKVCDLAIVGDLFEVVPALMERLEK